MNRTRTLRSLCLLSLLAACGDSGSGASGPPRGSTLAIVAGDHQVGRTGEALRTPLTVTATGPDGQPLAGVTVHFGLVARPDRPEVGISAGSVTLAAPTATTDAAGRATMDVTLGDTPGRALVEATLDGAAALPARFRLTAYPPDDGVHTPICLLSFNDFHMHFEPWGPQDHPVGGLARLTQLLQDLRAANDAAGIATVIFNAGDDFENTLFQDVPGAYVALVKEWDRVGVDFYQIGNHEFHFGIPYFADDLLAIRDDFAAHTKGHPLLITFGNADPSTLFDHVAGYAAHFESGFGDPADTVLFQQTVVREIGGLQVGVLGAVTDAAVYVQIPGDPPFLKVIGANSPDAQGMTFFDPDPREDGYIGEAIDDLDARGADLIVVNSHTGLGMRDRVNLPPGKDEHIARHGLGPTSGRAVDVIISGHSHVRLNHAVFLDNPAGGTTGIVQGLEGGVFVTRSDLWVDPATDAVTWIESDLLQVDAGAGEDPVSTDLVLDHAERLEARHPDLRAPVAQVETFLSSRERTTSGMGQLINAAFQHTLADDAENLVSFVVPSTYRTDLHPGSLDLDLAYQVLSMHKMDAAGDHPDTIATVAFAPGRYDFSLMGLESTIQREVTGIEYFAEAISSLQAVLKDILPTAADELQLEVVQFGRLEYVRDATAPPFQRVVPGSVRIGGAPPDPEAVYRIAAPHSLLTTISRVMGSFVQARDPLTGEQVLPVVLPDPDTGEPFTDIGVETYESLHAFLADTVGAEAAFGDALVSVAGDEFRTLQPDLTANPADLAFTPPSATPGEAVTVTAVIRNLGETAAAGATVDVWLEATPWDWTDDPDRFAHLQGLPADHPGSCRVLGSATLDGVGAYPGTATAEVTVSLPTDLPPGRYPLGVRIRDVTGAETDPHTGATYTEFSTDNNGGRQRARLITVR